MIALVALLLILAPVGGLGFAAPILWYALTVAVLSLIGVFAAAVPAGGGRRRYGRR